MENKRPMPYPLRMPEDMREALEAACLENGRSLNAEIVARLSGSFEKSSASLEGLSKEDFKAEIRKHVLDDVVSVFREVIEEAIIEATPEKEELHDS